MLSLLEVLLYEDEEEDERIPDIIPGDMFRDIFGDIHIVTNKCGIKKDEVVLQKACGGYMVEKNVSKDEILSEYVRITPEEVIV